MLLTFTDQVTTTVLTIDGDVPTPGGVEPFQTPSKTTSIHCSGPNVLLKRRQNCLVSYKYIQKNLSFYKYLSSKFYAAIFTGLSYA